MSEAIAQNGASQNRIAQLEAELLALKAGSQLPIHLCPHGLRGHGVLVGGKWSCEVEAGPLKLDLGCGNSTRRAITKLTKETGWTGVDVPGTEGADVACDLGKDRWPWPDSSVDEVNCAHTLEHFAAKEVDYDLSIDWEKRTHKLTKIVTYPRVYFFNELWRVLKPGAKALFTTPHWCSCRAYGDVTHEWPPVSEMFWQYLNKAWRTDNAPHTSFTCDFELPATYGYMFAQWLNADVAGRNAEFTHNTITQSLTKYKEAAQDMQCTLTARK